MTIRIGSVIELVPDSIDEYEKYHAEVWPGVLDALSKFGVVNYSIYRHGAILFSYLEYVGDDYDADMASMAADPVTQEWQKLMKPLQRPLPDRSVGEWWKTLPEVFHMD